jgi:hypothetical protein
LFLLLIAILKDGKSGIGFLNMAKEIGKSWKLGIGMC